MGRWAFARGFVQPLVLTISVVLRIAGLPEPSIHKPCDFAPFLFPEKLCENSKASFKILSQAAFGGKG